MPHQPRGRFVASESMISSSDDVPVIPVLWANAGAIAVRLNVGPNSGDRHINSRTQGDEWRGLPVRSDKERRRWNAVGIRVVGLSG